MDKAVQRKQSSEIRECSADVNDSVSHCSSRCALVPYFLLFSSHEKKKSNQTTGTRTKSVETYFYFGANSMPFSNL